MDNTIPYLCGGIFFSLLNELKLKGAANDKFTDKYGGISDVMLISSLHYVITGHEPINENSLSAYTSKYRHCTTNGGKVIPFSSEPIIKEFDELVKNNLVESIKRMEKLAENCLDINNENQAKWIIDSILRIIRDDNTIDDLSDFFILGNNQPVSKKNMLLQNKFDFYPFLIGILHYIITKPTDNTKGQATYEKLFPNRGGNGSGNANTDFLTPLEHDISVQIDKQDVTAPSKIENEIIASHPNNNQCINFLYKSGSIKEWEEELIKNNDPSIVDLNKNPEGYRIGCGVICRLTTNFKFSTHFSSLERNAMVKINYPLGDKEETDFASFENWESRSKIDIILFKGECNCTAWIKVEGQTNTGYLTKIIAMEKS